MSIKYKDPQTRELKEISVKASDTLPIGTVVEYDGTEAPNGWEKVKDNSEIIELSVDDFITVNNGFSIKDFNVCRQGKHIFGYLAVLKSSNFTGNIETIGTLKNNSKKNYNFFGVSSKNLWGIPTNFAYAYISLSTITTFTFAGNTSDNILKFYLDYLEQ